MPSPNLSNAYNVLQAQSDLEGVLHGTTINQVTGITGIFNRAARQLLLDLDPQETLVIAPIGPLFDQVYNYPISSLPDLKGDKVVDIRPQVSRTPLDQFSQTYAKEFDVFKSFTYAPNFITDFNSGIKYLRIDATNLFTGIVLNNADGGTVWTAGPNVSNIQTNSVNYVSPTGSSLEFNIASGANPLTASLSISNMIAVNLSTHQNQSVIFWWVYLPQATHYESVSMSWGSDATDYWTVTATENWTGTPFVNGWNLIGVPWVGAAQTGNPNASNITYLNATYVTDGTQQTATQLNYIVSRLGVIYNIQYYSKYLFRSASTGLFQETTTATSDYINLDTDTFELFFDLVALFTVQQIANKDYEQDIIYWDQKYHGIPGNPTKIGDLARYKAMYKSQQQQPKSTYYRMPKPGYQRYYGAWPFN